MMFCSHPQQVRRLMDDGIRFKVDGKNLSTSDNEAQ
jgi:hypothetical protein